MSHEKYFSLEELKRFQLLEGKKIQEVVYFVWINRLDKDSPFVFIDKFQLKFHDGTFVTLTAGEESDALYFLDDFDPIAEALEMDRQFNGSILLKEHRATDDKYWAGLQDKTITSVRLSKQNDQYLADAVILDVEGELRLIGVSPEEGILIDFYEDI